MRPAIRVMTTCLGIAVTAAAAFVTATPPLAARAEGPPAQSTAEHAPGAAPAPAGDEQAFPVELGSFTTTMLGSLAARTVNVRLAAEALDGVVLEPGDVLSFNVAVGPRTLERGYQPAPVILHETRQTQVGGGVCQVASTLFVAGLLSGLDVAERWRHSNPVDYIATGEDATIAWGAKDLKLRNVLGQRIRVQVRLAGSALSVRFDAEEPLPEVFELETAERELPADADGGGIGREIELVRVRRDADGREQRELVHRDVIPPVRVRERE